MTKAAKAPTSFDATDSTNKAHTLFDASDSTNVVQTDNSENPNMDSDSTSLKPNSNSDDTKLMTVYERINRVMQDVGHVQKTGYNSYQRYAYTSEVDLIYAIRDSLVKYGLVMYPAGIQYVDRKSDGSGDITDAIVTYRLTAIETGQAINVIVVASGQDKGDKGAYKLMTGALKYAIRQTFLLPSVDDDPEASDGQGNKTNTNSDYEPHPMDRIVKYAKSKGINLTSKQFTQVFDEVGITLGDLGYSKRDKKVTQIVQEIVKSIVAGTSQEDAIQRLREKLSGI